MKRTIPLENRTAWNDYVQRSHNYDFYHTHDYHCLEASGESLLFVYQEGEVYIAVPVVKRRIPGTDQFDLSSVYGYTGPVSNRPFHILTHEFSARFCSAFQDFFEEQRIISVFLRMHPFYHQSRVFDSLGGMHNNGDVVAIDLQIPIEEQRARYQPQIRANIKKLQGRGFTVREASGPEAVYTFHQLYTENMHRVQADEKYFFSETHFNALLNSSNFKAMILFVYNEFNQPVCGTIIVLTNHIMQAHLIATADAYLADSPAKLMVDHVSVIGRELGMRYYNLGGGFGFKRDNLFRWKTGFSHTFFAFTTWRYIANVARYAELLASQELDPEAGIDFFPLYRYKSLELSHN
ncbi:GNAT family N-acetyltransferase [Pedobacter sp. SYP-B3415]|uniref:GNAT family N-acetyltransferase n=1 Tax=Pedobacter sp. SYP-B3415 TaxID=2496641 RepID=UPI00101CFA38|nr:GNAT family N-acetyltransferase [Pedobacter sp. SYP-B3415]